MKLLQCLQPGRQVRPVVLNVVLVVSVLSHHPTFLFAAETASQGLSTAAAENTSLDFETPEMEGTIRLDGRYHGVSRLVDKRTGRQVINTPYSALNLFKLMSVNQIMGQPRGMERTMKKGDDWAEVTWPATESHHAELTARWEVVQPNMIDLTVKVQSQGAYRGYELFLSSYFFQLFEPHVYLWARGRSSYDLVVPTLSDVFRGTVVVFPRDAHAARFCVDGRWERNERRTPTVQMVPVRHYAHSVAFMADPEKQLAVVLMSRPRDCYAISARYHIEQESDRMVNYSAFDLSLFGNDFVPGSERTVKVRLALTPLDDQLSQPMQLYQAFIQEEGAP